MRKLLDGCIRSPSPSLREWEHGVPSCADGAKGAHLVFELGGGTRCEGGQAGWLAKDGVDDAGHQVGWEEEAERLIPI